jgi:hypothetical protein
MFNRIAVAYSYVAPGSNTVGTRATTPWVQNDDSVSTYGQKEIRGSLDGATSAQAAAARDALLAQSRYPIPDIRPRGDSNELTATLECAGWWDTNSWRYLTRSAGLESYTDGSGVNQAIGAAAANARVAQSFVLGSSEPWSAYSVKINLRTEGTPADNVIVEVCANNAGVPGSVLATATIAGSAVNSTSDWIEFVLDALEPLALATTYWIVVRRSGGVDAANHYVLQVAEAAGYAGGVLRLYNGATWGARTPDADAWFKVCGMQETTEQIRYVLAINPFLTAVRIETGSGVYSSQYADGDGLLCERVEALLKSGTTNGRRLLATVTRERTVRVYEEPASGVNDYLLTAQGDLQDSWELPQAKEKCTVGVWAKLKDVIPATVDTSKLADPSRMFIESAEFNAESLAYVPEPRSLQSVWELGQGFAEL